MIIYLSYPKRYRSYPSITHRHIAPQQNQQTIVQEKQIKGTLTTTEHKTQLEHSHQGQEEAIKGQLYKKGARKRNGTGTRNNGQGKATKHKWDRESKATEPCKNTSTSTTKNVHKTCKGYTQHHKHSHSKDNIFYR